MTCGKKNKHLSKNKTIKMFLNQKKKRRQNKAKKQLFPLQNSLNQHTRCIQHTTCCIQIKKSQTFAIKKKKNFN